MRPILPALKKQIAADPWMKFCCLCGTSNPEWEHCWIYAGRQINEWWAIIPLCYDHHRGRMSGHETKERGKYISLKRAMEKGEDLNQFYPRVDWGQQFIYLTSKYGEDDSRN